MNIQRPMIINRKYFRNHVEYDTGNIAKICICEVNVDDGK